MGKSKKRPGIPKRRFKAIRLWIIAFFAAVLTLKDSVRLFLSDIPEMLSPTVRVSPKQILHASGDRSARYIVSLHNASEEVLYDVQLRVFLGDVPFEAIDLIPLSGPEAEKKAFPPKVIAINPFIYGIYGVNDDRENVAYFVFKKFDPKETKTVEFGVSLQSRCQLPLAIRGFSESPSPYTENTLNHRFREKMSVVGMKYYGANIEGIKDARIPLPSNGK